MASFFFFFCARNRAPFVFIRLDKTDPCPLKLISDKAGPPEKLISPVSLGGVCTSMRNAFLRIFYYKPYLINYQLTRRCPSHAPRPPGYTSRNLGCWGTTGNGN